MAGSVPVFTSPSTQSEIGEVLANRAVRAVYQPVVDLGTGEVVAYEALARGPQGTALERPDALFAAAAAAGSTGALDRLCREVAIEGARDHLVGSLSLFVNVEPATAGDHNVRQLAATSGAQGLRVVAELTERDLTTRPAELLRMVEEFRALGWGIALDDVGADPDSLALLPLLRPDVIKLDLSLVQDRPSRAIAAIFSAVNSEAERSGAVVLAEGIETEEHLDAARSLGATLGQGWLLGRPATLPTPMPSAPRAAVPVSHVMPRDPLGSPFARVTTSRPARATNKSLLTAISHYIETQALALPPEALILTGIQTTTHLAEEISDQYARLAQRLAFVGLLGAGLAREPAPGVSGADLADGDPLHHEWDMVVVAPHFAVALVARDLGDEGPELERRFEYVLTHDRDLAIEVAGDLMSRIATTCSAASALDRYATP